MYVKVGASDELLPARSEPTSQIDLVYGPRALCTLTAELPSEAIYIMTLGRSTSGINKAEDDGRMDAQIGFADALRRAFPSTVPAISNFVAGYVRRFDASECR